jgi:two-component system chemotaxis response regulator CheY
MEPYGDCDIVVDGVETVEVCEMAIKEGAPYDLILLDIMMPEMDGQEALKRIRTLEKEHLVPTQDEAVVIMVTALDSPRDVIEAYYRGGCSDYVTKPITQEGLLKKIAQYKPLAERPSHP